MFEKEVTLRDGRKVKVRGLKWKEVMELKSKGLDITKPESNEGNMEVVDAIARVQFGDEIDEWDVLDVLNVSGRIVELTFMKEDEEKNSESLSS